MFVCVLCRYFYCIQNKGGFIDSFCLKLKKTCKLQNYIKFLSFLISSVAWIFWLLTYFLVFSDFYHRQHFGKSLVFFTESAIPRSRSLEQKHKRWWIKRRKKILPPKISQRDPSISRYGSLYTNKQKNFYYMDQISIFNSSPQITSKIVFAITNCFRGYLCWNKLI